MHGNRISTGLSCTCLPLTELGVRAWPPVPSSLDIVFATFDGASPLVTLAVVFIPAIAGSNSSGEDGGDSGGQTIGNMTIRNIDPLFFLTVFYYGVTMQAVGNGTMAGLMSTGRFSTGFKHSGMMILVSLIVFNFLAFTPNLIGITEVPGLNPSSGTFVPSPLFLG